MIPSSTRFDRWYGARFSGVRQEPKDYIEACERASTLFAENDEGFLAFVEELAIHIRESSFPPEPNETQWSTDESLRSLYYDLMGPAQPPADPYPVPPEHWGQNRFTWYMLHAVDDEPEWSSNGATTWLTQRGLTHQGVYDGYSRQQRPMINVRPTPHDYTEHLEHLTHAGLREPQPGEPSYPDAS